jgi:hypothetical protein
MTELTKQTEQLEKEAERILKAESLKEQVQAQEEEAFAGFTQEKIKLIPTPNFSDAKPVGTMLPKNMANETVTNLSLLAQEFDFIDFLKEKLGYSSRIKVVQSFASEQVDALVLAIKSFEKNNAFILGDMAGIGKGRVCAGVIRYAYTQGIIPVFLTQKPYLLNDIYRDIKDIDGLGVNDKGLPVAPRPFVMHNEGVIMDREGNPIPTNQVYKTTYKNGEAIYRFVDRNNPYSINDLADSMSDDIERTGKVQLSKDFNCVMLPYSVISQSRSVSRKRFLNNIAPNTIFIFDESHNAASANMSSNILRVGLPLVEASKAVLFSSATYAKNPSVFNLYVVKTALRTAVPSLESITDALNVGGENVSEYIASGLVKEGQMIRRERSFGDCKKITEFVGAIRKVDSFDETAYSFLPDDTQRAFYDEAIGYFKELRDFAKSEMAAQAVKSAVLREVDNMGKEVANSDAYKLCLNGPKDKVQALRDTFIKENKGKYILNYTTDTISRYKATFRENLFLAIKAKFSADKIIECLNTPIKYTNVDGTEHIAPMKPIIAIANTGERIFADLRFEEGQEVKNDFSEYIRAIYNKMFLGSFTLRKVDKNIFESMAGLTNSDVDFELLEGDFKVEMDDFFDGGVRITEIQDKLNQYKSELPFSCIDYIRDAVESTERSRVYFGLNNAPLYGQASSAYYRFAEGTSRKFMLKRDENGILRYQVNDRIRSTTKVFRAFNSGGVDVMLINVVASTGGSAQSSPNEGVDTRPRNMFVVQFELDINVEVQKRGRINRTGQLNSPSYTYIITQIPVELRKYLMFRKKLRKLDANTSADQTASSGAAEMTDSKGNPIEDIFNHYGFQVFKNDFIELPENMPYTEIFNDMSFRSKNVNADAEAEQDEINIEHFNAFVRELELYPAKFQEYFFDEMNEKYIQKKAQLIAQNEFQEELDTQDYKASLKQRVVVQLNSGSTVFSLPLFLSDYYTLDSKKPLSKDKMLEKANELAVWDGQALQPMEAYSKLLEDFLIESKHYKDFVKQEAENLAHPTRDDFAKDQDGEDAYDRAMYMFEAKKNAKINRESEDVELIKRMLIYFKPFTKIVYGWGGLGMFLGYKIQSTSKRFKYTKGSIQFVFAFLQYPLLYLKLTTNLEDLLAIKDTSTSIFSGGKLAVFAENDSKKIDDWRPVLNRRVIRRFFAGNILSGIVEAAKQKKEGKFNTWALTRFNNIDGSINTAIELKFEKELPKDVEINVDNTNLAVAAGNSNTYDYVTKVPISTGTTFEVSSQYGYYRVRFQDIYPIWNIETEKIADRAICIVKRKMQIYSADERKYIDRDIIQFEVIQSYIVTELKDTRQKLEKARKVGEKLYNNLYHDQEFESMFVDHLITKDPQKKVIQYAFMSYKDPKDKSKYSSKYNDLKAYIKTYQFLESDVNNINVFLNEIYKKYEISFNFRSDVGAYFNVETQVDTFDTSKKEQQVQVYPNGEYEYRFIRNVSQNVLDAIPNLIRKSDEGAYGGVVLVQPLMPNMLPSYEMKPYKFDSEIYVKLTLAVFSDEDKSQFIKQLEDLADVKNADAYEIGEFVKSFLTQRTVGTIYFFGDLRISDYGKIFQEYALKQDLSKLIFNVDEEAYVVPKQVKNEVNLDDAESFIIKLWSLI